MPRLPTSREIIAAHARAPARRPTYAELVDTVVDLKNTLHFVAFAAGGRVEIDRTALDSLGRSTLTMTCDPTGSRTVFEVVPEPVK